MFVVNTIAVIVYELRISFLSERGVSFPTHLEQRGRLIRSVALTTLFSGLQWISAYTVQRAVTVFGVLFLVLNFATVR